MPFTGRSKSHNQTKSLSSFKSKEQSIMEDEHDFIEPKFPIRKYDYLEGRNYRKSSRPHEQFLPCDDEEIERLQVNHLLFKNLFITPFFAPVEDRLKEGIKVLDVASGPGWWIADMGIRYPKSHFTGIDPMMFPISSPPTNCHFRVADISKGLPFPDNTFDFVTQHDVLFKYNQSDWDTMLPELVRVCKPGGYIELVEPAGQIQDVGPNMSVWLMRLTVSLQSRGIDSKIATQLGAMLEAKKEALDHVEASHRSAPIGWYGKNGDLMLECIERLFDATKPKLCEDWSMEPARYDKVTRTASAECRDFRSWFNIHFAFAQKKEFGINTM